jgi:hypothetical protein
MTARTTPYPSPGFAVRIPDVIWEKALETVRAYASRSHERSRQGSEALIYLAGVVAGQEVIVTALYGLNHTAQGDRVVVTPEESRWLLRTLKGRDEKLIGQIHSHRGHSSHSHGDDLFATSFHEGFLSVVVPGFGQDVAAPEDCWVLEFRSGTFVELDRDEVLRRLRVVPQVVERPVVHEGERESKWIRFVRRLKLIGRRRP